MITPANTAVFLIHAWYIARTMSINATTTATTRPVVRRSSYKKNISINMYFCDYQYHYWLCKCKRKDSSLLFFFITLFPHYEFVIKIEKYNFKSLQKISFVLKKCEIISRLYNFHSFITAMMLIGCVLCVVFWFLIQIIEEFRSLCGQSHKIWSIQFVCLIAQRTNRKDRLPVFCNIHAQC